MTELKTIWPEGKTDDYLELILQNHKTTEKSFKKLSILFGKPGEN